MRTRPDVHPTQFRKWRSGSRQPAIWGKRRSERSRTGRMWEPDRTQGRKGIRRAKGVRRAKGPWRIKRMEVPVFSFIRSLISYLHISHSHLYLHLHSLYFSRTHPPIPSYCRGQVCTFDVRWSLSCCAKKNFHRYHRLR